MSDALCFVPAMTSLARTAVLSDKLFRPRLNNNRRNRKKLRSMCVDSGGTSSTMLMRTLEEKHHTCWATESGDYATNPHRQHSFTPA